MDLEKRRFGEYYLIGTLTSFLIAIQRPVDLGLDLDARLADLAGLGQPAGVDQRA